MSDDKNTDVDHERQVEQWVQQLRKDELDVPSGVAQRLAAARREAVNAAEQRPTRTTPWFSLAMAGATAGAVALAVVILLRTPVFQAPVPQLSVAPQLLVADDVEFAVASEAELMEELEFVAWMVARAGEEDGDNYGEPTSG